MRLAEKWERLIVVNVPDEEDTRLGRLFNILMMTSLGIVSVLSVAFLLMEPFGLSSPFVSNIAAAFPLAFLPLSVFCMARAKQGHIRSSIQLYVWINFVCIGLAAFIFDGVWSPAWVLFAWNITIAGILLAPIYALTLTGGVVAYFMLLLTLSRMGLYKPLLSFGQGHDYANIVCVMLMLASTVGLLTYLNMQSLRDALERLHAARRIQSETNDQLSAEVNERKHAEKIILGEKEFSDTLINSLTGIFFLFNSNGKFLRWNKNLETATGYSTEEVAARSPLDYFEGEDKKLIETRIRETFIKGTTDAEAEIVCKDGKKIPHYFAGRLFIAADQPCIIGMAIDITERKRTEEALHKSEEQYRIVADNTYAWEFWIAPDGWFLYSSPSCQRVTGHTAAEFAEEPNLLSRIIHPEDRERFMFHQHQVVAEKIPGEIEFRILLTDGSTRFIHHVCQPVFDELGQYLGARGSNRDITEREQVEEALKENEEKFESISASAKDAILLLDNDSRISYWNRSAEEIFGYSAQEAIGKNVHLFLASGRYHEAYQKGFAAFRETGEGPVIGKTLELEAIKKDGTEFPIEISVSRVKLQGKWNAIGVLREITERKQVEQVLKESEKKYRDLVSKINDGFFTSDIKGIVTFANKALAGICGYSSPDELIGRSYMNFTAPEAKAEFEREFKKAMESGKTPERWEIPIVKKDGSRAFVEIKPVAVFEENRLTGTRGVVRDITERRHAEQVLKETNAQLAQVVSELEQRSQQLTLLGEMSQMFHATESAPEAQAVIAQYAEKLFPSEEGAVFVFRSSRNLVEQVSAWGQAHIGDREFAPSQCWGLRLGKSYLVTDPKSQLVCEHLGSARPASYLCVPVAGHGEIMGLLHVSSQTESLSKSRQQLALALAEQIGLALANVSLRETLRDQAIRDPLTNLYNRRYLEEMFDRELHRSKRRNALLGVVMIDIDHFKRFNDMFGHDAGDVLLRELAQFMKSSIRVEDIACRYGGEEFVLILPEMTLEQIKGRSEALRTGAKELSVRYHGRLLGTVTLSLGIAICPEHGVTIQELLQVADRALYQAKQSGRDQVVMGEETTPRTENQGAD